MRKYMVIDDTMMTPDELDVAFEGVSWVEAENEEDAKRKILARRESIKQEAAQRVAVKEASRDLLPVGIK